MLPTEKAYSLVGLEATVKVTLLVAIILVVFSSSLDPPHTM
jgi:hypothetical protein